MQGAEALFDNDPSTYLEINREDNSILIARIKFESPVDIYNVYAIMDGRLRLTMQGPNQGTYVVTMLGKGEVFRGVNNSSTEPLRANILDILIETGLEKTKIYELDFNVSDVKPVSAVHVNEGDRELYVYWPSVNGVLQYAIYLDGQLVGYTTATNYTLRDLINDKTYEVCVASKGQFDSARTCVSATPKNPDIVPPPVPFDLVGVGSNQSVRLTWRSDPVGDFSHYNIYRDDVFLRKVFFTAYTDNDVENDITYRYYVTAVDKTGNESDPSNIVEVTPYDDRPPPPPPPDPENISNEDLRDVSKSMFGIFDVAKIGGLLIVGGAIALGIIFIVARWLWRRTRQWVKKSK